MHFGTLNHCRFNPLTAACAQKTTPLLAQCEPESCANVVIPIESLALYTDQRDELSEYLNIRRLPERQRTAIERRIAKLDRQIGRAG
jgi:hypothetical protein